MLNTCGRARFALSYRRKVDRFEPSRHTRSIENTPSERGIFYRCSADWIHCLAIFTFHYVPLKILPASILLLIQCKPYNKKTQDKPGLSCYCSPDYLVFELENIYQKIKAVDPKTLSSEQLLVFFRKRG